MFDDSFDFWFDRGPADDSSDVAPVSWSDDGKPSFDPASEGDETGEPMLETDGDSDGAGMGASDMFSAGSSGFGGSFSPGEHRGFGGSRSGRNEIDFGDGFGSAKGGNGKGGGNTDGETDDGTGGSNGGGNGGGKGGGKNDGGTDGGTDGSTDGGTGGTLLNSYTSGSADGSGFNIEISFGGTWTVALQQSFLDAADLLSTIILGDITDVYYNGAVIDDIRIDATLTDIDGTGGILGQAGPTTYRTADFLPAAGIMEFDIADAEDFDAMAMFNDIVFHEMVHVLGFGTMWDYMGLVTSNAYGTMEFNGANADLAFAFEFGADTVSVETDGGAGTAGGHWNEGPLPGLADTDGFDFGNEIMTGFINTSGNYLSNTTIAALEDMGYDTVFDPGNPLAATSGLDLSIFSDHLIA
ncbi:leishmanolysin-related zinc metalloendopeptidase [Roseibium salinum]|uniref:Leishmanolysin n=1 Tax=Roseibium salinum TaxID=1604349 RepID=A0ABT3QZ22_9HYPH|nr:leishmanolysin-related zinc metalloendopeptidase [Roseibium sp. DSM 29163]MCX2722081.1 hypothetical protein [Roseibium sp. DSM 29163]